MFPSISSKLCLCGAFLGLIAATLPCEENCFAQTPAAKKLAPANVPPASGEKNLVEDPAVLRLVELNVVETSLSLVNDAIKAAVTQSSLNESKADRFTTDKTAMKLKGGGPVSWKQFNGRTAADFVGGYHIPVQFKQIMAGKQDQIDQARSEIAALGGKLDKLQARKRELEKKQIVLWGQISAAMVANREIGSKPLYSYHLHVDGANSDDNLARRAHAIEAFAHFLRVLDKGTEFVDSSIRNNQSLAFTTLKQNVEAARKQLLVDLANSVSNDTELRLKTDPLNDLAKNLTTAAGSAVKTYEGVSEAEAAGDESQKSTDRELLSQAIFDMVERTNSLDDGVIKLAAYWNVVPDTAKPVAEVNLASAVSTISAMPTVANATKPAVQPASGATDLLQPGSEWSGQATGRVTGVNTLTITQRAGSKFKAKFQRGEAPVDVEGTLEGNKISWTHPNGSVRSGTLDNDKILVTASGPQAPYTLSLSKVAPTSPATPVVGDDPRQAIQPVNGGTRDLLQSGSEWSGTMTGRDGNTAVTTIKITARDGNKFKAEGRSSSNKTIDEIEGTLEGNKISWTQHNGVTRSGTISNDTISISVNRPNPIWRLSTLTLQRSDHLP